MIKAVIFDLDGTLLNTLDGLKNSTNFALEHFGYPPHSIEKIRQFVGNGVAKLIERAIPNGLNNPKYNDCLTLFKEHYSNTMEQYTHPYDGILELLTELKKKNVLIIVLSNKFDSAVKPLCKKYFDGLYDLAIGENEANPPKPNPTSTLAILKHFNLKPEEVIFVGDSEVDVRTANNAKLKFFGVLWGFRTKYVLENEGAKSLINKPVELIKYL